MFNHRRIRRKYFSYKQGQKKIQKSLKKHQELTIQNKLKVLCKRGAKNKGNTNERLEKKITLIYHTVYESSEKFYSFFFIVVGCTRFFIAVLGLSLVAVPNLNLIEVASLLEYGLLGTQASEVAALQL